MAIEVVHVHPGPAATRWLLDQVRAMQVDDPLQAVTVVTPSHHAGLHLRRQLAARGYAAVRFTIMRQLAETLGTAVLAADGRTPLTSVARSALMRSAAATAGGPLAGDTAHPGLIELLIALAGQLRYGVATAEGVAAIRSGGIPVSIAALACVDEFERLRVQASRYDERDLIDAATAAADGASDAGLAELGTVVVHLPTGVRPPEEAMLEALADRLPVTVALADLGGGAPPPPAWPRDWVPGRTAVRASTVDTAAPDPSRDSPIEGARASAPSPAASGTPTVAVLIAGDPVEEVRAAVRELLAAAERSDPVPLHRAAIVYRDEETYGRILREVLDQADVPFAGLGGRSLIESTPARGLLGLLGLREQGFTRASVLSWLSGMPDGDGALRNQARWDQLSREAGVVRGAGQWRQRLERLMAGHQRSLERLERDDETASFEARRAALLRDIDDCRAIVEEVEAIDAQTALPDRASWDEYARWTLRLQEDFLTVGSRWEPEELESRQAVTEVVHSLAATQDVEPAVSVAVFRQALEDGLRSRRRPEGRLGHGVVIGPHRLLAGMDLDRVHVLGAVEGSFPATALIDPLLPGDALGRRSAVEAEERRAWLETLDAAGGGEVVLSAPRVGRDDRDLYPSPWLLDELAADGRRPRASDVRDGSLTHPALPGAAARSRAGVSTSLSLAERREEEARAARLSPSGVSACALARRDDLPLGRALAMSRARRSADLTEFDGNLAMVADLPLVARGLTADLQSPTRLEGWATCPFRHLLGSVLRVRPTGDDHDDRWWRMSPLDRGSLIHDILERFFADVVASGRPAPGEGYGDAHVRQLESIAIELFREAEERGITGHPLVWATDRAAIMADLHTVLDRDVEDRAAGGWRPAHVEQAFGYDDNRSWPALRVPLVEGREVALRGRIDRVDRGDGGAIGVIDYKTGRFRSGTFEVQPPSVANRLVAGRRLQLAAYGQVARSNLGGDRGPAVETTALYWFVSTNGGFKKVSVTVDEPMAEGLRGVVATIDSGVRAGCFPQSPGEFQERPYGDGFENCWYCDFDTLCPARRDVLSASKAGSAAVEPYRALRPEDHSASPT